MSLLALVASWVWAYWLVASIILGGALFQFFTGFVPGSGWRGFAFYWVSAFVVVAYGGSLIAWVATCAPLWAIKGGVVSFVLSLALAVVWFQPGESDGRTERPTTAPGSGGSRR